MAFFAGPPVADPQRGGHRVDTSRGHDDLARKIGENAERFARTMWRWEDMQVYVCISMFFFCCGAVCDMFDIWAVQMYRLLLEYARLVNDGAPEDS
jgi:hypothetical protein